MRSRDFDNFFRDISFSANSICFVFVLVCSLSMTIILREKKNRINCKGHGDVYFLNFCYVYFTF